MHGKKEKWKKEKWGYKRRLKQNFAPSAVFIKKREGGRKEILEMHNMYPYLNPHGFERRLDGNAAVTALAPVLDHDLGNVVVLLRAVTLQHNLDAVALRGLKLHDFSFNVL